MYSHPSAWTARHLRQRPQEWRHKLTEEDIAELERAAEDSLNAAGNGQLHRHLQTKADFPLPTLGPKLEAIRQEVMHGRGFALITGKDASPLVHPAGGTPLPALASHLACYGGHCCLSMMH